MVFCNGTVCAAEDLHFLVLILLYTASKRDIIITNSWLVVDSFNYHS